VDPLDWVHQWDDFEMMMYVASDPDGRPGVFMQVSQRTLRDGAEEWRILYDRRIGDVDPSVPGTPGTEEWEEGVLRSYLAQHPHLVEDEKAYVERFLAENARDDSGRGE
jgi:hypothetical protein